MPYLFDPSKLNYSGNKVAVRNLISVCNSYEEIYSNIRAQLTLAKDSVNSWYSVWNGAFQRTDISINAFDPEHRQFLKQLGIILDLFYNNINSILSTCSVPITMQYEHNTFTYYIPINNNMFKRQDVAIRTINNLEINCSSDIISLANIILNASNINRSLLFEYNLTDSIIENTTLNNHDISGYNISYTNINNSILEICDVSNSVIIDSYSVDCSFNNLDQITRGDISHCNIENATLNNCNIKNSDISSSNIVNTYATNTKINFSSNVSNSYFNICPLISNITGSSLYITNANDCSNSTISDSDFVDVSINNCKLYMDSINKCTVRVGCDISNTYIINSDISSGTISKSNVNTSIINNVTLTSSVILGKNTNKTIIEINGCVKKSTITECDLSGVYIYDCILISCNLFNCRLVNNDINNSSNLIDCTGTGNDIHNSFLYPYTDCETSIVKSTPVTINSNNINYNSNFFRTLRLKYLVGRLNNIGCYNNTSESYDYINDITNLNCIVGGRYFYKIGDFQTEIISIDLKDKTIGNIFSTVIGDNLNCSNTISRTIIPTPTSQWDENLIYETGNSSVVTVFSRLMDEINFSCGLLEDSRNLFNALL